MTVHELFTNLRRIGDSNSCMRGHIRGRVWRERLERQIQVTDREIDRLVYELYGLTDDEIKIVEGE